MIFDQLNLNLTGKIQKASWKTRKTQMAKANALLAVES